MFWDHKLVLHKLNPLYRLKTYSVYIFLVEKYEENDIISKATDSIHGWHLNDKCENVIDESVQRFICHHPPREMSCKIWKYVIK